MEEKAEPGDAGHRDDAGEEDGPAIEDVQPIDRVHAAHHQLGVADPDDVDDAEDEIEAEREEGEDAAEQHAVDDSLEQVDVHGFSPCGARTRWPARHPHPDPLPSRGRGKVQHSL